MSHYAVVVRIPASRAKDVGDVERALEDMMAPFDEQTEDERFVTFEDKEDEYRKQFEEETCEMIRLDGELLSPYDDRFRTPGEVGIGTGTHENLPPTAERVRVPFKERYSSFEQFCSDYHGSDPDPKTGKHGYWHNENAKWDWYQIGGRWRGYFQIKAGVAPVIGPSGVGGNEPNPGCSDVARVGDLDFDRIERESREAAEKFWGEWQEFIGGKEFHPFEGPRSLALDFGMLEVRQGPPAPGEEDRAIPWNRSDRWRPEDERAGWHDIYRKMTKEEFDREIAPAFFDVAPYAVLDESGWHEPGRMGWWAVSHAEEGQILRYKKAFRGWLSESKPDDWLVAVDVHI